MKPATVALVGMWLAQYAAASEQLKGQAAATAEAAWSSFDAWYDTALVAATAVTLADLSRTAQHTATGLAAQYVAEVVGALSGAPVRVPQAATPPVRNGVDLAGVHGRPAEVFRRAVATGADETRARELAVARGGNLMRTDLSLVERTSEQKQMQAASIKRYRRVLRPELSESGSCGLCIAASDRLYKVSQLMPIHPPHCKCKTMPVDGGDAGALLNAEDVKRLYAEAHDLAGSTRREDLINVRVKVNHHGELGPVLTRAGDSFRGPRDVRLEDDPARARRMLAETLPTLHRLERESAEGKDVAGPLQYQRDLVSRLRGIAA